MTISKFKQRVTLILLAVTLMFGTGMATAAIQSESIPPAYASLGHGGGGGA